MLLNLEIGPEGISNTRNEAEDNLSLTLGAIGSWFEFGLGGVEFGRAVFILFPGFDSLVVWIEFIGFLFVDEHVEDTFAIVETAIGCPFESWRLGDFVNFLARVFGEVAAES